MGSRCDSDAQGLSGRTEVLVLRGRGVARTSASQRWGAGRDEPRWYELFNAKGSLIVLCYLRQGGPSTKYGLVRGLKLSKEAINHAIEVLQDLGLCVVVTESIFPFRSAIWLSDQGLRLLETRLIELPRFAWRIQPAGRSAPPLAEIASR